MCINVLLDATNKYIINKRKMVYCNLLYLWAGFFAVRNYVVPHLAQFIWLTYLDILTSPLVIHVGKNAQTKWWLIHHDIFISFSMVQFCFHIEQNVRHSSTMYPSASDPSGCTPFLTYPFAVRKYLSTRYVHL